MPKPSLLERLKQRKIIQWAVAYAAGAFVVFQLLDALSEPLKLTTTIQRGILALVVAGFFITLVLAWYHGEKGQQRVSGSELLMLAAVLVLGAALLWWVTARGPADLGPESDAYPAPNSVAVLPCENVGGNEENASLVDGLHISILNQLASVSGIRSISRTSVLEYRGVGGNLRRIAEDLGVGAVMECSIQREGPRILVSASLVDALTDQQLWRRSYDRTLDDAFAVQSDIARQVVMGIGARLTAAEDSAMATAPTDDPEAWRLYLQGEDFRLRPGYLRESYEIAQQLFERAVARDPTFALAYASLTFVHGWIWWSRYDPSPARLERAREAAQTALRLAPDLPQARWALARVHYWEGDYARALEELTAVAEELPGSAELRSLVGYTHRRLGNLDETFAAFEAATALDPRDAELFSDLGANTFWLLHRYPDAIEAWNRALDLAPDLWAARLGKARVHLQWRGEPDSLRSVLEQGPAVYGALGSRDRWRARLTLWEREPDTLLALLGAPEQVTFDAQSYYEPGLMYAAWAHQLRGEEDDAAQAFLGALAQLDSVLQELPDDWPVHASRGLALAGLGRVGDARLEADWLTRSWVYRDAYSGPTLAEVRAMIFAQTGSVEDAIAELEPLLGGPSWTSAAMVRLDPRYDPIRDDPRFRALLDEYRDDQGH